MGIDSHFFPWRPRDEGRGEAIAGGASARPQFWPLSPTTDSLSLPDYSLHFLGRDDTTTSYVTARPQATDFLST